MKPGRARWRLLLPLFFLLVFAAMIAWSLAAIRHDVSGVCESELSVTERTTRGGITRDRDGNLVEARGGFAPGGDVFAGDIETESPWPGLVPPCPT